MCHDLAHGESVGRIESRDKEGMMLDQDAAIVPSQKAESRLGIPEMQLNNTPYVGDPYWSKPQRSDR